MAEVDFSIFRCPITQSELYLVEKDYVIELFENNQPELQNIGNINLGLVNKDRTYLYPIIEDIIILLPIYAIYIGKDVDVRSNMKLDRERVFNYYNNIEFEVKNSLKIFNDSNKWVDYREVSRDYIRDCFTRAKFFLGDSGKYLLDIASGSVGFEEFIELSEKYEIRICADISIKALIEAKHNMGDRKAIFVCADITNIPIMDNICDAVLCQHTLYHIPKNDQKTAVDEMLRVLKPDSKLVIVYSLFYHSWFMNITLFPIQIYRISRHFAGKLYVRLFNSKPRLYFYPHPLSWFTKNFSRKSTPDFYCWRSTNKYFLNLYIHKWLAGRWLLNSLMKSEKKHSKIWARIGDYPIIVITK